MNTFFQKYKVLIIGALSSIALAVQEFVIPQGDTVNWQVIALAGVLGLLSWAANEWRGKNVTITAIVGVATSAIYAYQSSSVITVNQIISYAILALLGAVAPPPKPSSYERDETIVNAKHVPPTDSVADNSKLPIGVNSDKTSEL